MEEGFLEIEVYYDDVLDSANVQVNIEDKDNPPSAAIIMCAAQYLMYLYATMSDEPFEDAMDSLVEGAMTTRREKEF